jgi:hypothetical protein
VVRHGGDHAGMHESISCIGNPLAMAKPDAIINAPDEYFNSDSKNLSNAVNLSPAEPALSR